MLNENAKKLVAALRSGEYKQTQEQLAKLDDDDNLTYFCCLGVAVDLFIKEHPEYDWDIHVGVAQPIYAIDWAAPDLPNVVRVWLKFSTCDGSLEPPETEVPNSLAMLNDAGATFAEIADLIESEPPYLFKDKS